MIKFFKKYSFLILLILTCLIALPFGLRRAAGVNPGTSPVIENSHTAEPATPEPAGQDGKGATPAPTDAQSASTDETAAPTDDGAEPDETPAAVTTGIAETPDGNAGNGDVPAAFTAVTADYFDDALFIGDSRTLGISEYAGLNNAAFFASTGMSVYNVFSEKVQVAGAGTMDLKSLLESRDFGKIYVMLGINELGYAFKQTVSKYSGVIDRLREAAPDALIFIEANLHVTAAKSDGDSIFNNSNIDRFNEAIAGLADGKTVFYLDVNPVFDDGAGNLEKQYTSDGVHVYGKYYATWGGWLSTKGIIK